MIRQAIISGLIILFIAAGCGSSEDASTPAGGAGSAGSNQSGNAVQGTCQGESLALSGTGIARVDATADNTKGVVVYLYLTPLGCATNAVPIDNPYLEVRVNRTRVDGTAPVPAITPGEYSPDNPPDGAGGYMQQMDILINECRSGGMKSTLCHQLAANGGGTRKVVFTEISDTHVKGSIDTIISENGATIESLSGSFDAVVCSSDLACK